MRPHYDDLETRSADQRAADQLEALNALLPSHGFDPLGDLAELAKLPVRWEHTRRPLLVLLQYWRKRCSCRSLL